MKNVSKLKLAMQQAEEKFVAARGVFNEAKEAYEEATLRPMRQALVGKCFKYRNCYSCPVGPKDYWVDYTKVVGVDGSSFVVVSVQKDKYGAVRIEERSSPGFDGKMMDGYVPITNREYQREVAKILKYATGKAVANG